MLFLKDYERQAGFQFIAKKKPIFIEFKGILQIMGIEPETSAPLYPHTPTPLASISVLGCLSALSGTTGYSCSLTGWLSVKRERGFQQDFPLLPKLFKLPAWPSS